MTALKVKKGSKKRSNANKNKLMARIHILKKDKGLDDDTYRDVLQRVTGKRSCSKMTLRELVAVIQDLGGEYKNVGKKPSVTDSRQALINKIEAIVLDMDLSWDYVRGMAQKMFSKQYEHARVIEWLNDAQLYKLTQALTVYQKRKEKKEVGCEC